MLFARKRTFVERRVYGEPFVGHSHYGFNWRRLRERVRHYLVLDDTLFTPLGFLGLGQQPGVLRVPTRKG
jgi:hypothetical protein